MLTTWDQRVRREKIKVDAHQLPGADDAGRSVSALREGDHAADQGAALLPHHEPHRPAVPGAAALRGWRASAASSPSSTARTRSRTSRSSCAISSATTTARACTSGCWRRTTPASSTCAASASRRPGRCRRRRRAAPPTSASSRRSARSRRRRSPRSTKRSPSTRRSASSARPRACAILTMRWANQLKKNPRIKIHSDLERRPTAWRYVGIEGIKAADTSTVPLGQVPDHLGRHHARRLPGHPRHAERLHDARRDRHVRRWRWRIC